MPDASGGHRVGLSGPIATWYKRGREDERAAIVAGLLLLAARVDDPVRAASYRDVAEVISTGGLPADEPPASGDQPP